MRSHREATGLQIAFFTLAVAIVSVPIAKWIVTAIHAQWAAEAIGRAFTLVLGAIVIVLFPSPRKRAFGYLANAIGRTGLREAIAGTLLSTAASFAVMATFALWRATFYGDNVTGPVPEAALAHAVSKEGLIFLFSAVIVAPVVEELVFRGFIFHAWETRWGWKVSAILTSTVFGLYHIHFASAFIGSIVLICVLRRTGSLRAAILVHATSNLLLWYPLLGQFVLPPIAERSGIHSTAWSLHWLLMYVTIVSLPIYIWLADRMPAHSATAEARKFRSAA